MDRWFALKLFASYLRHAQTNLYLHSPFLFEFYNKVLNGEADTSLFALEEQLKAIRKSKEQVVFTHPVSKATVTTTHSRIAATASVSNKYGRLLYRLCRHYQPRRVLELGTNIGIGTAYLAAANPNFIVETVEGSEELSAQAQKNLVRLSLSNVHFHHSLFHGYLKQPHTPWQLVYIDGHHQQDSTLQYFEQLLHIVVEDCVLVFDDINYNEGMHKAWKTVVQHPRVTVSIDLYRVGLAFLRGSQQAKEHFTLWY